MRFTCLLTVQLPRHRGERFGKITVWLCCFLVDSALNFIRRFKYVSLSQPATVV